MVRLALHIALPTENLGLTAADLLPERGNIALNVAVGPTLLVKVVACFIALLFESLKRDEVGVVA